MSSGRRSGDLGQAEREPAPGVVGPPHVASLEIEGLPGPALAEPAQPSVAPRVAPPRPERLPRGARAPRCTRAPGDGARAIETEHFRYVATRPAAGRLWQVQVHPVSASARYYIEARGEHLAFTCPLASLPAYIGQTERELAGYWGMALDTRRNWD